MSRGDTLVWTAIVALALAAGALGGWVGQRVMYPEHAPPPGLEVVALGEALPPLRLDGLHGGPPRDLSGPGRVRLINYWASWCGPCRDEMPALDAYATAQGDTGVEVVGIALDEAAPARAFAARVGVGFALLVERPGPGDSSVRLGNARGLLPFTVLVDADGRLQATHYGAFPDADEVAAWVEAQ